MAKLRKKYSAKTKRFKTVLTKEGQLIHDIFLKFGSVEKAAKKMDVTRQQAFRWCVWGHVPLKNVARVSGALEIPPICFNFKQLNELIVALGSKAVSWERTVEFADIGG